MNERGLAIMWLRDRAKVLHTAATKAEHAYTTDPMRSACHYVASAYRQAAKVLLDAADAYDNPEPDEVAGT